MRKYIIDSKAIRFEGNGYGEAWKKEAKKRGLTNLPNAVDALKAYISKESIALFEELDVMTAEEIKARYEIKNEIFTKNIQIEARVLGDLAINHIVPTAIRYQSLLIENVKGLKDLFSEEEYKRIASSQLENIALISEHINAIQKGVKEMIMARKKANVLTCQIEKAEAYSKTVKPYLESIREPIDRLELMVDNDMWTLPKYRELLFFR